MMIRTRRSSPPRRSSPLRRLRELRRRQEPRRRSPPAARMTSPETADQNPHCSDPGVLHALRVHASRRSAASPRRQKSLRDWRHPLLRVEGGAAHRLRQLRLRRHRRSRNHNAEYATQAMQMIFEDSNMAMNINYLMKSLLRRSQRTRPTLFRALHQPHRGLHRPWLRRIRVPAERGSAGAGGDYCRLLALAPAILEHGCRNRWARTTPQGR